MFMRKLQIRMFSTKKVVSCSQVNVDYISREFESMKPEKLLQLKVKITLPLVIYLSVFYKEEK